MQYKLYIARSCTCICRYTPQYVGDSTCISVHSAWIVRIWARDCHLQVLNIYISAKYIKWWWQLQTQHTQVFGSKLHQFRTPNMVLPWIYCPTRVVAVTQHSLLINSTLVLNPFFSTWGCTGFNWKMQHLLFYMSFNLNLKIHTFHQGDFFGNASWYY